MYIYLCVVMPPLSVCGRKYSTLCGFTGGGGAHNVCVVRGKVFDEAVLNNAPPHTHTHRIINMLFEAQQMVEAGVFLVLLIMDCVGRC